MVKITQCQCQGCITCHGGGCTDKAVMILRFKIINKRAQVGVCEMCGCSLLGAHPDTFEQDNKKRSR